MLGLFQHRGSPIFILAVMIFGCCMWNLAPRLGIEPGTLHWEGRVLVTGPPGRSPEKQSWDFSAPPRAVTFHRWSLLATNLLRRVMDVSSKQQPDFSEDSSGTVRKALPNHALQCWLGRVVGLVRWRGTGQETQRRHCRLTGWVPGAGGSSD